MAEVLVGLITAAQLPDEGQVRVFGRLTTSITAVDDWVTELDRFGLISTRAVLVDQFTAEQNLALPLTLEIDNLPAEVRAEVTDLARDVGLSLEELAASTGDLSPLAQLRLRLGRAIALRPRVLLAEHPSALLSGEDSGKFAMDFSNVTTQHGIAVLVMTTDPNLRNVADRVLELQPATGALIEKRFGLRRWFS
jgi:putative ABC transport system ATP-binding protein